MEQKILLEAGSGGRASQRLIESIFLKHFKNHWLSALDDGALLPPISGPISMSTDSYTVSPLFFPGGSIGDLAVNGTVNDIAALGAEPLYLSAGFIIEEGLPISTLDRVAADMAAACAKANVRIVTGDTKVVPAGACDKLFINTAGIGRVYAKKPLSGHNARPGDLILLSGTVGDHGLAVMAAREDISFVTNVRSDTAPLAAMIKSVLDSGAAARAARDPTRGGLATTLNEIARQSGVCVEINEENIPISPDVDSGCSFMGLDPLYLANEGKLVCIVPEESAQEALKAMRADPAGKEAAVIGRITDKMPGKVLMRTRIGGERVLGMLEGDPLPRIC